MFFNVQKKNRPNKQTNRKKESYYTREKAYFLGELTCRRVYKKRNGFGGLQTIQVIRWDEMRWDEMRWNEMNPLVLIVFNYGRSNKSINRSSPVSNSFLKYEINKETKPLLPFI